MKLPQIEELEEERNELIEELDKRHEKAQELSFLLEQVTAELTQVQKRNEYLELTNQNH